MRPFLDLLDSEFNPDDVSVKISELLIATSDASDALIDDSVQDVLRLLREHMKMDVVFVSEFTDGKRVFRQVDTEPENAVIAAGESNPLEESWCQYVVEGRLPPFIPDATQDPASAELEEKLPFRIGTHISAPIVLKSGEIYGTLCCFSFCPQEDPDSSALKRLQYAAQLTANRIEQGRSALRLGP